MIGDLTVAEQPSEQRQNVMRKRREKYHFLLTAWVFLRDPAAAGPAIIFPPFPVIVSRVMESIKVGSTLRINTGRGERGLLWQPQFLDRALRCVKIYYEKVEYIHLNPVRAGLVKRAEERQWSSVHDYTGGLRATFRPNRTLAIDRVLLPAWALIATDAGTGGFGRNLDLAPESNGRPHHKRCANLGIEMPVHDLHETSAQETVLRVR